MIGPLLHSTNPSIGVYARVDGVHVRISAKGKNRQKALELIEPLKGKHVKYLEIQYGVVMMNL